MDDVITWAADFTKTLRAYDDYLLTQPRYEDAEALGRFLETQSAETMVSCTGTYTFLDDEDATVYHYLVLSLSPDFPRRTYQVLFHQDIFALLNAALGLGEDDPELPLDSVLRVLMRPAKLRLLAHLCQH